MLTKDQLDGLEQMERAATPGPAMTCETCGRPAGEDKGECLRALVGYTCAHWWHDEGCCDCERAETTNDQETPDE